MYVTLLRDIPQVGKKTERVLVSDAYARNVLLPKKFATIGEQSAYRLPERTAGVDLNKNKIEELLKAPFAVQEKANEQGALYKKISSDDLQQLVSRRIGIPSRQIKVDLDEPLKKTGHFEVSIRLPEKIDARISVTIDPL